MVARAMITNHGPGAVRVVTAEGGPSYVPPVLLESGQAWNPAPGQDAVTVTAAFGTTLLELVGLATAPTSDPCPACDGAGCDGCGRSGRVLALAPEPAALPSGDSALLERFRAAWRARAELAAQLRAFLCEKRRRGAPAFNEDFPGWAAYDSACIALQDATVALAGVECL